MDQMTTRKPTSESSAAKITRQAQMLSAQLQSLRTHMYPPEAMKSLRTFTSRDVATMLGIAESTLRQMSLDGEGAMPERLENGRRSYTLAQVNEIRRYLAVKRPMEALDFFPRRRPGEKLQVIAVANFKGGSAKTTTTVHLAHYLALTGLRVLAIDLDPQASLSAMFGYQPEFDVSDNETIYAAIRYDDDNRRPMRDVIRKTYFDGIDLIPGNLELMEYEHETPQAIASGGGRGDGIFFRRLGAVINSVEEDYDVVVIDAPPQLGYLTLGALCAATSLLITVHPAMIDVASMNQFLAMMSDVMHVIEERGGVLEHDFIRYVITRHNPNDVPQVNVVALLRSLFGEDVLAPAVVDTTAIASAGLEKKSLYEMARGSVGRDTLTRALDSVDAVNLEIFNHLKSVWGRS
ncbi:MULTISPECIES: plasmid partitioning protein RepA [Rhizobium]|uniref:Plasmid partitioning protein RepA n=1 Tax=Rhizobium leguminosarum bv. trifolii (strain WSM1325) TaxID=395491 RepID=C6B8Q9_RHILS|nr:plasmid partitioning protein RepA [Rhizobium leguminosarum]ACS60297.1 plasmid partitioning protein RepA [Rhizobium leguminosarum bv. trifolii WSM1325]MBY2911481.1 plasmid partitioning protein RepA [Rhizobium leguminosarum]MBY2919410.1 plasmid partitioning protein RepA [Rhizobium leguminosarum]MBY2926194.1 plasmid partitioning protein RepA [Rhizobium leguminosarum]MBY2936109.1 plasmid partitioning protein RepA [Rhizobium leguminosarum]